MVPESPVVPSISASEEAFRPLYYAGEWVMPGTYLEIETRRLVHMERQGTLPPTFNGHVACYIRYQNWGMVRDEQKKH